MSEIMLHGVLNMPPELWGDDELSMTQRYSCYMQASREIEDLNNAVAALVAPLIWNVWETGKKIPENITIDVPVLVKIKRNNGAEGYRIGNFYKNNQGYLMGTVGDCFVWDREIEAWAEIQQLL